MPRWMLVCGALAVAACNKGGDSGGEKAVIPPDCDDFMTALTDCYAEGGFSLADGGIDATEWCTAFTESGASEDVFACYLDKLDAGDCASSSGIAAVSDSFNDCAADE